MASTDTIGKAALVSACAQPLVKSNPATSKSPLLVSYPERDDIAALLAAFKQQQISINQLVGQNRLLTEQNEVLLATLRRREPTAPTPPEPDVLKHTCMSPPSSDIADDPFYARMESELRGEAHRHTSPSPHDSDGSAHGAEYSDTEAEQVDSAMGAECSGTTYPDTDAAHDSDYRQEDSNEIEQQEDSNEIERSSAIDDDSASDVEEDSNEIERSSAIDDDSASDVESCASEAYTGITCEYALAELEYGYTDPDDDDDTW